MLSEVLAFFENILISYPPEDKSGFLEQRNRENFSRLRGILALTLILFAVLLLLDFRGGITNIFKWQAGLLGLLVFLLGYSLIRESLSLRPPTVRWPVFGTAGLISGWLAVRAALVPGNTFYLMLFFLAVFMLASFIYFYWYSLLFINCLGLGLYLAVAIFYRGLSPFELTDQLMFILLGMTASWYLSRFFYYNRVKQYQTVIRLKQEIQEKEERKQHLEQLLEQKNQLTTELENQLETVNFRQEFILKQTKSGFWEWDLAAGRVKYDNNWARLLDYHVDQLKGRLETWKELVHPRDKQRVNHYLQQCRQGEITDFRVIHRLQTANGDWKWVQTYGEVKETDDRGQPLTVVGINSDMTVIKRLQERLKQSQQEQERFMENLPLAILIYQDGDWVLVNQAAERLLGYSLEEIKGKKFADFLHPDYQGVLQDKSELNLEETYRLKIIDQQDREHWIEFAAGKISFQEKPAVLLTAYPTKI